MTKQRHIHFIETLMLNVVLIEDIRYTEKTGSVGATSYFGISDYIRKIPKRPQYY
jgi:hypothetical protein